MFVIIGIGIVIVGVLGGYLLHGGPLGVLLQWSEFMIIGGAAAGSLLVSSPLRVLKQMMGDLNSLFKGEKYTKEEYLNLLKMLFELFHVATREGLIAIEHHVEKPEGSAIFKKNPFFLNDSYSMQYLCDTMKVMISGGVHPHDVESLLDADLETHHAENSVAPNLIQKLGDALPGLGIVAAVLGIVVTMQAINGPPEEIGHKVAAALVGTFLGVLMSYGFIQPMASHLELLHQSKARYLECIKAGIVAYAKGNAPIMAVEFSRRVIYSDMRPSFREFEEALKAMKASG